MFHWIYSVNDDTDVGHSFFLFCFVLIFHLFKKKKKKKKKKKNLSYNWWGLIYDWLSISLWAYTIKPHCVSNTKQGHKLNSVIQIWKERDVAQR